MDQMQKSIQDAIAERESRKLLNEEFQHHPRIVITYAKKYDDSGIDELGLKRISELGALPVFVPTCYRITREEIISLGDGFLISCGDPKSNFEAGLIEQLIGYKPLLCVSNAFYTLNLKYGGSDESSIKSVGNGLSVVSFSADGNADIIQDKNRPFVVGIRSLETKVQSSDILKNLVQNSRRY